MYKAALFDFNGVIVDDYPLQKEAWDQIATELRGSPVTDSEMTQKIRGVPTAQIVQWVSPKSMTEAEIQHWVTHKETLMRALYQSSSLYRRNLGLDAFLTDLQNHQVPRTIVTSSTEIMMQFSFERLELSRWFDLNQVIFMDGTFPGKPAPDPYLIAARRLSLSPIECVVFEDALSGVQSAQTAGVGGIVVVGETLSKTNLSQFPSIIQTIHNFSEIKVPELFK